jgi:arginine-tRNA-protein transferase
VHAHKAEFDSAHFELYRRYITARHAGGGMENPNPDSYMDFLTASWASTNFYEVRRADALVAVAVVDHLNDALSAVYTFFDPELPRLSLGRFAILKEIELARELKLKWLYLGYWIRACRKMSYKVDYAPHQYYLDGAWRDSSAPATAGLLDLRSTVD